MPTMHAVIHFGYIGVILRNTTDTWIFGLGIQAVYGVWKK